MPKVFPESSDRISNRYDHFCRFSKTTFLIERVCEVMIPPMSQMALFFGFEIEVFEYRNIRANVAAARSKHSQKGAEIDAIREKI